jgi:putative peptide zinc metalloprotease protein
MDLWDGLPVGGGGGDVWELLADDLKEPSPSDAGLGIWGQVSVLPGGLWSEAKDETLEMLVVGEQEGIWQETDDETLILDRGQVNSLWAATEDELDDTFILGREEAALWEELDDETLLLVRPMEEVWTAGRIRGAASYRPVRALGWALKELETAKGEPYWILKNLRQGAYLRLNEQQVYLWKLMDGSHSVQDLAVACFIQFQVLSIEGLEGFLGQLYAKGFLVASGADVYQAAGVQLWRRTLNYWAKRLVGFLFSSELSIKGVDRFYGTMYRLGARILFTRPVLVLFWLVSLAGLPAFFYIAQQGDLSVVGGTGSSLGWGLVGLLVAEIFAIFAHESAHALTTKHYGRTVRRGGVGLYFGMVTFFMDTTDIWMEPRRPRLAVTWAGPFSGFFLGGLASLALLFAPATGSAGVAYQFASFCYGISILNLNPLLKLDGYYLLMDWLEMPMLRERAMRFVQGDLWRKLFRRESLAGDERVFAIFGLLSLLYTVVVVVSLMRLVGRTVLQFLQGLLGRELGLAAMVALAVGLAAVLLWPYVRRLTLLRRSRPAPAQ